MKKITFLTILLSFFMGHAQPTTNAPTPAARDAVDVLSIYSDAYSSIAIGNYNPQWNQSGSVDAAYDPTGEGTNTVLAYTNFNYQGTEFGNQDASAMEYLHVDVWTATAGAVLKVTPINNGTGTGEVLVEVALVNAGWSSVDIPKASFTGMTWDSVFQLKFDGNGGTTPLDVYIDNIYFWKEPTAIGTDVTLSDLTIDGTTIATSDITVGAGKTLDVSAGTLTLANDQISGDKVEGGTIASITISQLGGALDVNNENITNVYQ